MQLLVKKTQVPEDSHSSPFNSMGFDVVFYHFVFFSFVLVWVFSLCY